MILYSYRVFHMIYWCDRQDTQGECYAQLVMVATWTKLQQDK